MANAWDDLPNAKHIDRVMEHAVAHPDKWQRAAYNVPVEVRADALNEFRDQMLAAGREEQCAAARAAIWGMLASHQRRIGESARTAITALVAWDDCAYILDLHPDVVRTLSGAGNNAAILMLPAVIAMYEGD